VATKDYPECGTKNGSRSPESLKELRLASEDILRRIETAS
tara:strand:+ start:51 stop:170 length:120 start_codon:yes stop_codon:yes gene_type:complete